MMKKEALEAAIQLAGLDTPDSNIQIEGSDPVYYSPFRLGEGAAVAHALVGAKIDEICQMQGLPPQNIYVDTRHAAASLSSYNWLEADVGDLTANTRGFSNMTHIFSCRDGRFIQLHRSFRDGPGIAQVLDIDEQADLTTVAAAVRRRDAFELEAALIDRNLTGAVVRDSEEWNKHQQGMTLAQKPIVEITKIGEAPPEPIRTGERPLSDVRVLDLTRVLAGPTSARTLAEHGADVLHVSSPDLPTIERFEIDTGHGKRQIHADLKTETGLMVLNTLIPRVDVFSQGFRKGALDRLGFGPAQLAELRPGVIYVSENCYGHEGPWAMRPGWEQFAQSTSGIAKLNGELTPLEPDANRTVTVGDDPGAPRLAPAAMNDYVTAYFAAYGALEALKRRAREGGSWHVQVSLTQSAMWFLKLGVLTDVSVGQEIGDVREFLETRDTPYGEMTYLRPALEMSSTQPYWAISSRPLGSDTAEWLS